MGTRAPRSGDGSGRFSGGASVARANFPRVTPTSTATPPNRPYRHYQTSKGQDAGGRQLFDADQSETCQQQRVDTIGDESNGSLGPTPVVLKEVPSKSVEVPQQRHRRENDRQSQLSVHASTLQCRRTRRIGRGAQRRSCMRKLASLPSWSRIAKQLKIGNEADDRRAIESTSTHDLLAPSFLSLHDNHLNLPPSIVEVGIPPVCARCWRHPVARSPRRR